MNGILCLFLFTVKEYCCFLSPFHLLECELCELLYLQHLEQHLQLYGLFDDVHSFVFATYLMWYGSLLLFKNFSF